MDYYNDDSKASEPLDFLSPSIQRGYATCDANVPLQLVNLKNKRLNNFYKNNNHTATAITGAEPTTSLIVKKTTQTKYLGSNPVNNTPVNPWPQAKPAPENPPKKITQKKPLIKVTVIQKPDQNHNKLYRKRRYIPNKVQSTSSNQDNSIQPKNVYLVVAGRRKEKIYEIRTTGSAEFSNDHSLQNEGTPVNDLLSFKQVLQSLNMEKKRKKDKRHNDMLEKSSYIPDKNYGNDCNCTNTSLRRELNNTKDRIRLYGNLGVTENDKYVIQYGTSVNYHAATSNGAQLLKDFSPFPIVDNVGDSSASIISSQNLACNENEFSFRKQRDSCIQADFEDCRGYQNSVNKSCECRENCKGSQGTQVNFNIQFPNKCMGFPTKIPKSIDKTVQCGYEVEDLSDEMHDNETLKQSQNPLVIISVYPKQNSSEIGTPFKAAIENKRSPSPQKPNKYEQKNNLDRNREKGNAESVRRDIGRSPGRRSPSPTRNIYKGRLQENKEIDTRFFKSYDKRKSPERQTALKNIQEKDKLIKAASSKKSTAPATTKQHNNMLRTRNNTEITRKEVGVNTDHLQTKKALVDSYTNKLFARMNQKHTNQPRIDTSKVNINIDGEKEYYDVLFQQDDVMTDLTIRKKLKDVRPQKSHDKDNGMLMENLLMLPAEAKTKTTSLARYDNQSQCGKSLTEHVSRLTIRDSIEICHRREDKANHRIKNTQACLTSPCDLNNRVDTEFLAPIKHYTGDDCSICDPMARDREIRQLLGVNKCQPGTSNNQQDQTFETDNTFPYHCFYRNNCNDKSVTEPSLRSNYKTKSNSAQCEIQNNMNIDSININNDNNGSAVERTSLYQQLVLNRNIQVFLQVEQFSKHKPIVLTRKQYHKVKRTIQKTISKNISHQKHKYLAPTNVVSIGEIKKKKKIGMNKLLNKEVQTDVNRTLDDIEEQIQKIIDYKEESRKHNSSVEKKLAANRSKSTRKKRVKEMSCDANDYKGMNKLNVSGRRTMSSVEVHYANVAYAKHVTFSSKGQLLSTTSLKEAASFLTIFRGHRKPPTPNLGTSAYSLYSDEHSDKSIKVLMEPRDSKRRKPFLRRLMSYLVMRSTKGSEPKLDLRQPSRPPTVDSSIDSYYISSSLAGVEVSSSIYDTSASFYSNHTIYPVNSKIKRGFLSSVRGFLSNRRS